MEALSHAVTCMGVANNYQIVYCIVNSIFNKISLQSTALLPQSNFCDSYIATIIRNGMQNHSVRKDWHENQRLDAQKYKYGLVPVPTQSMFVTISVIWMTCFLSCSSLLAHAVAPIQSMLAI